MTNFMGYSFFNEIRSNTLQAYNRANIYLNIKERHGIEHARRYLKKMNRNSMLAVATMMYRFHNDGYENVRRSIIRERNA